MGYQFNESAKASDFSRGDHVFYHFNFGTKKAAKWTGATVERVAEKRVLIRGQYSAWSKWVRPGSLEMDISAKDLADPESAAMKAWPKQPVPPVETETPEVDSSKDTSPVPAVSSTPSAVGLVPPSVCAVVFVSPVMLRFVETVAAVCRRGRVGIRHAGLASG